VISAALINYANAARYAAGGKTASVPQAVTRLGTSFVKRVVFVAEMMARYQKGACPAFDYRGFWLNAIATGATMRALLPDYGISITRADDAFTTGLVAGIGWLAVAETFPALMQRYLESCRDADPVTKARAQREIFPCEICKVTERYLQRFAFPEVVRAAVAGRTDVDRQWYDVLARAVRIGQGLSPFACLAIPTTIPVPDACREEWQRWQAFIAALR
jgi:HD-like signal output (HDOD) protein